MQDKTPKNGKGRPHGRWVIYVNHNSKRAMYRAYFIDGLNYGVETITAAITQKKAHLYYAR